MVMARCSVRALARSELGALLLCLTLTARRAAGADASRERLGLQDPASALANAAPSQTRLLEEAEDASSWLDKTDINPHGNCASFIKANCPSINFGDARAANCIRDSKSMDTGNEDLFDEDLCKLKVCLCKKEVRRFFKAVANDEIQPAGGGDQLIPVDVVPGFRDACTSDAEMFCNKNEGKRVLVLPCLKGHADHLSNGCKDKMLAIEIHEANNFALDIPFHDACIKDIDAIPECKSIPHHADVGKVKHCLKKQAHSLKTNISATCLKQLFAREKADAKDIRLHPEVHLSCRTDEKKFCGDIQFGAGRVIKCLWDHKYDMEFSTLCKQKVMELMQSSLRHYELDFRFQSKCRGEIRSICEDVKSKLDTAADVEERLKLEGVVITCMKENFGKVNNEDCQNELKRVVKIHADRATMDPAWHTSCWADVVSFCPQAQHSEAAAVKVHMCLRKHLEYLSEPCREAEVLQGSLEAKDIMMKPVLKRGCADAIRKFCGDVPHGDAQIIHCLQDHRHEMSFPAKCANFVEWDLEASNHDLRLKFGISGHCRKDAEKLCPRSVLKGGAGLIACMKSHFKRVEGLACRQELGRFFAAGLENIHAAPDTYDACVDDVAFFCSEVRPGQGRIHSCLVKNVALISDTCKIAEFEQQSLKANNILLSPTARQVCRKEMKAFCSDILFAQDSLPKKGMPEKGVLLWRCLEDNKMRMGATDNCRKVVVAHEMLTNSEFHLNPQLAEHCKADAAKLCAEDLSLADSKDFSSDGGVISCLITNRLKVNDTVCRNDMLRKQRQRLENIQNDPEAVRVCSSDIDKHCSSVRSDEVGGVHTCLQANIKTLTQDCRNIEQAYMAMKSENIKLMPRLMIPCMRPLASLCHDSFLDATVMGSSSGQAVDCLLDSMHHEDMPDMCKNELLEIQKQRANHKAMSAGFHWACAADLLNLVNSSKCGKEMNTLGKPAPLLNIGVTLLGIPSPSQKGVVDCLIDNRKSVKTPACRKAIVSELRRQSNDLRAKPGMWKACSVDVRRLCPHVSYGSGRLHSCLRDHRDNIENDLCVEMVLAVQIAEGEDFTINPRLREDCAHMRRMFCKGVPHGNMRIIECLAQHTNDTGFDQKCSLVLTRVLAEETLKKIHWSKRNKNTMSPGEMLSWLKEHELLGEKGGMITGMIIGSIFTLTIVGVCWWAIQRRLKQGYAVMVPRNLEA